MINPLMRLRFWVIHRLFPILPPNPLHRVYAPNFFNGKLVAIGSEGTLTVANAIAPNAIAALYYVDAWSNMLTPLYGDGKVFNLPTAVASAAEGTDLFLGAAGTFSTSSPDITPGIWYREHPPTCSSGAERR
jgi:hypothetical protein